MFKQSYSVLAILIAALGLISCDPSARMNKALAERNKQEPKIIYPAQHIITPAGTNYVYDYAQLFTPEQNRKLDTLVRNFEQSNLIAVKIITSGDAVTEESFSQGNKKVLDEWAGTHGKSDKCMLIAISKPLHKAAVDYGSFVGKLLSRQQADQIIASVFAPAIQNDQYYQATAEGASALMDAIRKNIRF